MDDCSFIFCLEVEVKFKVKVENCCGLLKNKAYKIILTKLYISDISLTPSFSSGLGREKTLKCFGAIFFSAGGGAGENRDKTLEEDKRMKQTLLILKTQENDYKLRDISPRHVGVVMTERVNCHFDPRCGGERKLIYSGIKI